MKQKVCSILILLFGIIGNINAACNSDESSSVHEIPETIRERDPKRKRMPSRNNVIWFQYEPAVGAGTFSNFGTASYLSVTLTDFNGNISLGYVTKDSPTWYVNLFPGEYYIYCIADTGIEYEGLISI